MTALLETPFGFSLPNLDDQPAEVILEWAIEYYFPSITLASSMQDAVLVDLALKVEPRLEVFFLDTGFHFRETLDTAKALRERYDANLVVLYPELGATTWDAGGYDACCAARKVAPMERLLATKRAWISGLRRAESASRTDARAVEWDARREMVKINPLVAWSDEDIARYSKEHDILQNPLREKGYGSIGCAPCTLPGLGREGRWSGTSKTECGIHLVK
jgi:phosphoadenosine phosphosulfate reductase